MLILLVAIVIGIATAEIAWRVLTRLNLTHSFGTAYQKLRTLSQLETDQQRQQLLLQTGRETLLSSVGLLALTLLLLALVLVVPHELGWGAGQLTLYFVALSIVAPLWWLAARALRTRWRARRATK